MKHSLPSEFANRALHIAVAGAGGNGSQIISGLARMHVALKALGHDGLDVCVFDPDVVTDANVGRQLFSPSDVGCYKSDVLVHRINCYFGLNWNSVHTKYKAGQRFSDERADFLIGCVDSAAARRELAVTKYRYWLDLGNQERKGQVVLGTRVRSKRVPTDATLSVPVGREGRGAGGEVRVPFHNSKLKTRNSKLFFTPPRPKLVTEIFPEIRNKRRKEDDAPSCSLAEALGRQDLFINQSVATFALQLLWQFIRQGGLDIHGYFINLETGRVNPLPIK